MRNNVPIDESRVGLKSLGLALKVTEQTLQLPDDGQGYCWFQIVLPEGGNEVITMMKKRLYQDFFRMSEPGSTTGRVRRAAAVNQEGRQLATQRDEVEEIIEILHFLTSTAWTSGSRQDQDA